MTQLLTFLKRLKWFHFTRLMGAAVFIDQAFIHTDGSAREVLIIIGAGFAGYDFVARSNDGKRDDKS